MARTKKTFSGYDTHHREPIWAPLLAVVGHRLGASFMWMREVQLSDGRSLHVYKHRFTRQHLYLTTEGEAVTPTSTHRYRLTSLRAALTGALCARSYGRQWANHVEDGLIDQVLEAAKGLGPGDVEPLALLGPPLTDVTVDAQLLGRVRRAVPDAIRTEEDGAVVAHAIRMYALQRELRGGAYDQPLRREDRDPMLLDEQHHTARFGPPFPRDEDHPWFDAFDRDGSAEHSRVWAEGWEEDPAYDPVDHLDVPF